MSQTEKGEHHHQAFLLLAVFVYDRKRFDRMRFDDVVDLKITRAKKCGNDCNITAAHTVTQKHSSSSCDCHKKTRAPSVGALLPLLLYCCRTADAAPLLSLQRVPWLLYCGYFGNYEEARYYTVLPQQLHRS